jgi:hypothetical protein
MSLELRCLRRLTDTAVLDDAEERRTALQMNKTRSGTFHIDAASPGGTAASHETRH